MFVLCASALLHEVLAVVEQRKSAAVNVRLVATLDHAAPKPKPSKIRFLRSLSPVNVRSRAGGW